MAKLLDKLSKQMNKLGFSQRTPKSRAWLKTNMANDGKNSRLALTRNKENQRAKSVLGRMYFYVYDPKTKETLPY